MNALLVICLMVFIFLMLVGASILQVFLIEKFKKKSTQVCFSPGTIVCTSSTKPIPGDAEERAYEVDTNKFFVSDGWNWLPAKIKK